MCWINTCGLNECMKGWETQNSVANQKVNVSRYKCLAGGESEPQRHVEITDGFSNRTWTAPGWDLPLIRDPLHLGADLFDKGPYTLLVSFSIHSCLRTRRGTADNLTFIFNCQASPKWNRYLPRQAHQPAFEAIRSSPGHQGRMGWNLCRENQVCGGHWQNAKAVKDLC